MPKRKRGTSATSWDKHPQYLHFTASQSASDTTTTTTIALPREAFAHPSQPTILEILGVWFDLDGNVPEGTVDTIVRCYIGTRNLGTTAANPADTSLIAWDTFRYANITGAPTASFYLTNYPKHFHCCPDGIGMLVATDNLYIQVTNTGTTTLTWSFRGKILYRFVKVGLPEYVGILQSQQ